MGDKQGVLLMLLYPEVRLCLVENFSDVVFNW